MRAGQVAYASGQAEKAHRIWRRAAMLSPGEEQVWLALLNVLDDDEDRRVCLQNIVALNPNNQQAKRQLKALGYIEDGSVPAAPMPVTQPATPYSRRRRWLWRISWLLAAFVIGILLAIAKSLSPELFPF
jgi:ferric-dicitrate binding protein FerR (iron transport regulator)